MALALVPETGSGIDPTANSYADLDFIRDYNLLRGRTLSATDDTVVAQAIQAMDYLASLEPRMSGSRVFGLDQPLAYPRQNVTIYGTEAAIDDIPVILQNAQAELTYWASTGVTLQPTFSAQAIKRRKTGPIEKEFFAPQESPSLLAVDAILAPLLVNSGMSIEVVRV